MKFAQGRAGVLAGTGSNCTDEAIELTANAKKIGANSCLLATPYYNRPTQEGLYRHFRKIAESVDIPLVLYNIPSRTGVNILPETVARLSEIPNIAGIKEASGSLGQVTDIRRLTKGKFAILSGDDSLFLPMMSVGGVGVISVLSNILVKDLRELYTAFLVEKDVAKATGIHTHLAPLIQAMFIETNPIPVKEALYLTGMIEREYRLPLCPMSEQNRETLAQTLAEYGLISKG